MQKILSNFKFWIDNARWIALPQSILPALVAWVMAWRVSRTQNPLSQYDFCSSDIQYSFSLALLALIGVILLHLGLNLFDDYFDYKVKKTQYRNDMAAQGIRARVAKCAYLKEEGGTATLQQLLYASLAFCFAALLIGCVIWFYRGNFILYVSLLSAIIGLQYSGDPLRLSYHGLGELTVGFIFGPLLMIGVYYSACGFWNYSTLWIFASIGLLVSNILYTHSILDFEPDKSIGKRTLAVLVNRPKIMLLLSLLFNFLPFVFILLGILVKDLSIWYLFLFLTFPMACALYYRLLWFVKDPHREFKPTFWMGPVQQWDKIQEAGIEWFMVRWLLSRNYVTFFCILIILINLFN